MEEQIIDLSSLLNDLDRQIAEAAEHLARLRGQREGVLMAVQVAQTQTRAIHTNGVEQPA